MAYQPYYPAYQPYTSPMMDNLAQLRAGQYQQMPQMSMQAPQSVGQSMIWVSGQMEAGSYPLAPNSAIALWDSTAPVIYLKQADASGKPTMQIFDLVERVSTPQTQKHMTIEFATKADLDALAARVEALSRKEGMDDGEPIL